MPRIIVTLTNFIESARRQTAEKLAFSSTEQTTYYIVRYTFVNTSIIASILLIFSSTPILDSVPFVYDVYLGLPAEADAVSTDGMNSVHFVQYFGNEPISPDRIPTPFQQVKDRVPADEVACNDDRVLML